MDQLKRGFWRHTLVGYPTATGGEALAPVIAQIGVRCRNCSLSGGVLMRVAPGSSRVSSVSPS